MENRVTFDLSFPVLPNVIAGPLTLSRVQDGIVINTISGLKLTLLRETSEPGESHHDSGPVYRIHSVSHIALGRDEKVYIAPEVVSDLNPSDPYFTRHRDTVLLDVVLDFDSVEHAQEESEEVSLGDKQFDWHGAIQEISGAEDLYPNISYLQQLLKRITSALDTSPTAAFSTSSARPSNTQSQQARAPSPRIAKTPLSRKLIEAVSSVGIGAGTLPDIADSSPISSTLTDPLPWSTIYVATDDLCNAPLPSGIPRTHQILIIKRGACSFADKLANIPSFPPSATSLQLVIVVSFPEHDEALPWIRPLVDRVQVTPGGIARANPIPMVMVDGDDEMMGALREKLRGVGVRRRHHFSSQGLRISNLIVQ